MSGKTYTRDEISKALNAAADLLDPSDPDTRTLIDFVVNAALSIIDGVEIDSIENVIDENWDDAETRVIIREALDTVL